MYVLGEAGRIGDIDYSNEAMCLIWEQLDQASAPICIIVEGVSSGKQITEVAFLLIHFFFSWIFTSKLFCT